MGKAVVLPTPGNSYFFRDKFYKRLLFTIFHLGTWLCYDEVMKIPVISSRFQSS